MYGDGRAMTSVRKMGEEMGKSIGEEAMGGHKVDSSCPHPMYTRCTRKEEAGTRRTFGCKELIFYFQ
jgi:hypothetical protein